MPSGMKSGSGIVSLSDRGGDELIFQLHLESSSWFLVEKINQGASFQSPQFCSTLDFETVSIVSGVVDLVARHQLRAKSNFVIII